MSECKLLNGLSMIYMLAIAVEIELQGCNIYWGAAIVILTLNEFYEHSPVELWVITCKYIFARRIYSLCFVHINNNDLLPLGVTSQCSCHFVLE